MKIPLDYTPVPVITIVRLREAVSMELFLSMGSFAGAGIVLAVFFLAFNIRYRNQR